MWESDISLPEEFVRKSEEVVMLSTDTDDRIIMLLSQNADLTYKEMAKKLRLNESTVRKRVLSLRRRGVIKRFLVEVDEERMGYKTRVMLGVDAEPSKMIEVGKKLVAIEEARMVFNVTGDHDFQVVVWTRDRESFASVLNQVNAINGVTKATPSFVVEWLK